MQHALETVLVLITVTQPGMHRTGHLTDGRRTCGVRRCTRLPHLRLCKDYMYVAAAAAAAASGEEKKRPTP